MAIKKQDESKKRSPGGQPGHKRHTRAKLTPEEATKTINYGIEGEHCPKCNGELKRCPEKDKQYDRLEIPHVVIDKIISNVFANYCLKCQKLHYGDVPSDVVGKGLICDTFVSLITMVKSKLSLSIKGIQDLFYIFYHVKLSTGYIQKVLPEVMWILRPSYLELLGNIIFQRVLYIDETGTKRSGKLSYLWIYYGKNYAAFKIGTRGLSSINSVLGSDYSGIIITDGLATYNAFCKEHPNVKHQLCNSHLLRDIQFCCDHNIPKIKKYGDEFQLAVQKFLLSRIHK